MDVLGKMLNQAGLTLDDDALQKMSAFLSLLLEWNKRMDLTSVAEEDIRTRHFLDSLLPLTLEGLIPQQGSIIDVGSGAGFPGVPLAIARPGLAITLLEAQAKRCQFLNAAVEALSLHNVQVVNARAEIAGHEDCHREQYDRALARAVAPANVLCEYLLPFVRVGGCALCWKGPAVADEMEDCIAASNKLGAEPPEIITMHREDNQHVLLRIRKSSPADPRYPRKNGIPAKRPIKAEHHKETLPLL